MYNLGIEKGDVVMTNEIETIKYASKALANLALFSSQNKVNTAINESIDLIISQVLEYIDSSNDEINKFRNLESFVDKLEKHAKKLELFEGQKMVTCFVLK